MPEERLELSWVAPHDFESCAYTISPLRRNVYNTPAMAKKQKVLILVGPTSSGKSALAVELARKFDGEVISADSRQVYRGLNIGTGKITKREMRGVRHHLLDIASPKKVFTAHDFLNDARRAIFDINTRGKLPLIVGGTGFYIDALVGRITLPDVPANQKLRARLQKKTTAQLFEHLKKVDARRAHSMNSASERNNKVRLIRAIEIAEVLGKNPISRMKPGYNCLWIGIAPPKKELEKKITIRLFGRISRGMVAEAKRLRAGGLSYKRMKQLGLEYRSLAWHVQGKISRQEMVGELDRDIRHYAKRQMRYWKRNKKIKWFKPSEQNQITRLVYAWVKE